MIPQITTATPADLDVLVPLFDAYRVFYSRPSDADRARNFLRERLDNGESVIFIARSDGQPAGFIQMFPSFSSVSTARIWVLNDLYVAANRRGQGIARALMRHAARWAKERGAARLILETARDNHPAKSLYDALGWELDTEFDRYSMELDTV